MEQKTQFPITKWAQRKDYLFVTINVVPVKPPTVDIIDGKKLKYAGSDGTTASRRCGAKSRADRH